MTIIKDVSTSAYIPSPSRLAKVEVRQELDRLQKLDLNKQIEGLKTAVEIGGIMTYWSKGLSKNTPAFLEHGTGPSTGVKRIHIYLHEEAAITVYDRREKATWERRALLPLADPERILASIPKKSLLGEATLALATPSQLAVIRKNLEMNIDEQFVPLAAAAVSRLIDRLTCERDLVELYTDAKDWASGPMPE
jgi:hypothetical protein